ncbi:uncharacterized protein K452DRAFT_264205 [Aplosporella prunicola CBS 121167]|uniref:Carrier domain-containing protein n=1 Tax=Aplosporella prunicola CBS 121167 TaxID=1176127 RepID=A0A6A6BQL6_9PEZI|nr:uncharacterized protein K452DRAFT_264205 [Aplosporella prunicola CBS 121167]KAF2146409.1 hypothetical protein K452DRAFT_264205 [Aplosporella prunicola CBS 121167]
MPVSKEYGRRLIPTIVDELAQEEPDRAVYSIPHSQDVSEGFRDISASVFANAINRTAWWLESEFGRGSNFETVGYIGPHDLRYVILIIACVKAGYKALLPSPRNSIEATLAVLNATNCNIWVTPKTRPDFLPQILSQWPMNVLEIPESDTLLQPDAVAAYPYNKTFEEAANDPFCVLHTSGSTGLPKPIVWKNSLLGTLDATRLLPESYGRRPWTVMFEKGDRYYCAFPLYHGAGLLMNILVKTFYDTCNVMGPVGVPPTINLVESLLDHGKIDIWSIIPSIVDDIGEAPHITAKFASAKFIVASGGPVTFASADKATKAVRICNITGTSEGLFQGSLLVEPEDWIYFSFHPYAGFEFREIAEGVYEHWAVRNEDRVGLHQGIFHTFPDVKEMTLKDLYSPHPTKPNLWIYRGRTDDLLVMTSGEKIRPLPMEAIINSHPAVSAALVIGTGQTMLSLLIELVGDEPSTAAEREALLDSILERVHIANSLGPSNARIFREYIWFAKPDKPFVRTDKNTVKRRDTVLLYEREIEQFYESMEEDGNYAAIDITSPETIARGIRNMLVDSLPSMKEVGSDEDLSNAGLDSALAFRLSKSLRSALADHEEKKSGLTPKFVYAHPTMNALARASYDFIHKAGSSSDNSPELQQKSMEQLLAKYTAGLPSPRKHVPNTADGYTLITTGSTGSLGSYLLESLLHQDKTVKKIYCLNRSEDGKAKQTEISGPRGLTTAWSSKSVEFLQADLSKPELGLEKNKYDELLRQATHIIHNQWPVNYNWDIASFEPHIRGVRNLIDFAYESNHGASLFFVSTIATVSHLRPHGAVPEAPNHILTSTVGGYGSGKQVSELILEEAVKTSGVNASICRVGQIAGPVLRGPEKGMWGKQEWLPTIIASSKYLGVLPSTLGPLSRVDWIPVDILADVIVELSGAADDGRTVAIVSRNAAAIEPAVYHAVNPNAIDWASLVPSVAKHLGESITIVEWDQWMDALRKSTLGATATVSLKQNPALKLLDFFESWGTADEAEEWPVLETAETAKKSTKMAELQPVSEEWMELWLRQWKL